ncbi:MAG TPA: toll/interleukin-1 receptor domain-containing protein [Candidatus Angelobacter sp.]|nr:toll/interleukin-1 receptor domain-containing protein [Candidatus Angelobacter sp.]
MNATEVDKEFDLFISYAKEDEPQARRLANLFHDQAGLRIYFAPRQLPTNESNPQALLISALKRSHGILLLWSQWIDKSEWVALEAAIFATDRSIQNF